MPIHPAAPQKTLTPALSQWEREQFCPLSQKRDGLPRGRGQKAEELLSTYLEWGGLPAAEGGFELLRHGGRGLQDFQNVTLRGLRYKDNQLDLDLEGDSLAVFDQLKQRLSDQSGIRVEMRASKRDNRIESRLTRDKG